MDNHGKEYIMTDNTVDPLASTPAEAPAAETDSPVLKFELPGLTGERTFDCSTMPAGTRLQLLKNATRLYLANRLNAVATRHNKDADVKAWGAYDEACKVDALQTLVAKPVTERPAAPDLEGALTRAMSDLVEGKMRAMGTGEKKARERVDPLIKVITSTVVKEVFDAEHAADPKFTYPMAAKKVGKDGLAYLNQLIEDKVALGVDRAALEKMRDTKYVNPAKTMLGINVGKAISDLPNILG